MQKVELKNSCKKLFTFIIICVILIKVGFIEIPHFLYPEVTAMDAVYYHEHYYLLPDGYESFDSFYAHLKSSSLPAEFFMFEMHENYQINGPIQKGVSFAPYFIDGYNINKQSVIIDNINEVYQADIEVLTQEEYNTRLRSAIEEFCPGCIFYKPLSKNIRSLNGHFDEISLDKLCFIRQETKPSPRYFIQMLRFFGGYWTDHGVIDGKDGERMIFEFKERFYIKYDKAEYSAEDSNLLILTHKKDLLVKLLTNAINTYIDSWMYKTKLRISDRDQTPVTEEDILDVIYAKKGDTFRKDCKKYGISIGVLEFAPGSAEEITAALSYETKHNLFYPILKLEDKIYYLMTDTPVCLKALHHRHPMLQTKNAKITVYSQYGIKEYTVCRYMPQSIIE